MTYVQRRVERAEDAVNDFARSAVNGVGDMTGAMMGACEDKDIWDIAGVRLVGGSR